MYNLVLVDQKVHLLKAALGKSARVIFMYVYFNSNQNL